MPITYTIDTARDIILERWTGTISAADLGSFWRAFLTDPEVMKRRRTLVDVRAATISFTGPELEDLVHTVVLPVLGRRKWATAVLVASPSQYGTARQYQVFADSYSGDCIFTDEQSALLWLEQQHPDDGI